MNRSADDRASGEPRPDTGPRGQIWLADEAWKESWLGRSLPEVIYHYTDANGLLGIVQQREIWASHASFVNDLNELRQVDPLLKEVVAAMGREYTGPLVQLYLTQMPDLFRSTVSDQIEIYLACFCADGDQLSQWRGYPSAGGGYAIGFDPAALANGRMLRQVIYDTESQQATLQALLRPICDRLQAAEKDTSAAADELLDLAIFAGSVTLSSVAECGWTFKHPKFAEEQEYRLLRASLKDPRAPVDRHVTPKFRTSPFGLLPYTPLRFDPAADASPIREIVVGPNLRPEPAIQAVNQLLSANGYQTDEIKIRISDIPLRV